MRTAHSGETCFVCPHEGCDRSFTSAGILRCHLRLHSKEKPFCCPYEGCEQGFIQTYALTYHCRVVHSGEKTFVCPHEDCERAFIQSSALTYHWRAVHSGEKPFVCPHEGCERAFIQSSGLTSHMRAVHSGERPFICHHEGCEQAFIQSSTLKYHWRAAHSGGKALVCPHKGCPCAFIQARALSYHLRAVHSGGQSFVCPHEGCRRSFAGSGPLARHLHFCFPGGFAHLFTDGRKRSVSSRDQSGGALTRGHNPPGFQRAEAGHQLPDQKQYGSCAAAVARRQVQADLRPEVGLEYQNTGFSSDSSCSTTTLASRVYGPCDGSQVSSDRAQQRSQRPNLPSSPLTQVARFGWGQSPSATQIPTPAWLAGCVDDYFSGGGLPLMPTQAADLDVVAPVLTDDDKMFWQELIYSATGDG